MSKASEVDVKFPALFHWMDTAPLTLLLKIGAMNGEWTDTFELISEEAYRRMYDTTSPSDATARYSDAKEALYSAIERAKAVGDTQRVERLQKRLAEIKAVFRSQFS